MKTCIKQIGRALILVATLFASSYEVGACTRVVYKGPNNTIIAARSMGLSIPILSNLWLFPRGTARDGTAGRNTVKRISKYGSMTISSWDIAISDGMNEKGLVAHMLWLVSSKYPEFSKDSADKNGLAVSFWAQYALDTFATVGEAVDHFKKEEFVVTDFIPGTDKFTTVHLSTSDASKDDLQGFIDLG